MMVCNPFKCQLSVAEAGVAGSAAEPGWHTSTLQMKAGPRLSDLESSPKRAAVAHIAVLAHLVSETTEVRWPLACTPTPCLLAKRSPTPATHTLLQPSSEVPVVGQQQKLQTPAAHMRMQHPPPLSAAALASPALLPCPACPRSRRPRPSTHHARASVVSCCSRLSLGHPGSSAPRHLPLALHLNKPLPTGASKRGSQSAGTQVRPGLLRHPQPRRSCRRAARRQGRGRHLRSPGAGRARFKRGSRAAAEPRRPRSRAARRRARQPARLHGDRRRLAPRRCAALAHDV